MPRSARGRRPDPATRGRGSRRSRPGGAQPYAPATISTSVPQTPTAIASTRIDPVLSSGSGTSSIADGSGNARLNCDGLHDSSSNILVRRWVGAKRRVGPRGSGRGRRVRDRRWRSSRASTAGRPRAGAPDPRTRVARAGGRPGPDAVRPAERRPVVGHRPPTRPRARPNCAVGEWDMCRNGQYTERGHQGDRRVHVRAVADRARATS